MTRTQKLILGGGLLLLLLVLFFEPIYQTNTFNVYHKYKTTDEVKNYLLMGFIILATAVGYWVAGSKKVD